MHERRGLQLAALGSVCLHAAILSLPVGGLMGGWGASPSSEDVPIRATLRPTPDQTVGTAANADAPEPSQVPATAAPAKPLADVAPVAETIRREPADVVTIPGAYVDARQLTELPKPLAEPPLDMLLSILARPGVARLILFIDQSGRVTSVEVDSTTLPPEATERAVAIFSGVRFSPGLIGNLAVRSRIPITVGAEERKAGS